MAFTVKDSPPVTFQESSDFHDLIDTQIPYLLRLERVVDRETRIGDALEWTFAIHDNTTGDAILKSDGRPLLLSRITSPQTGPRTRTRRFIDALLNQQLSKEQLVALIKSGTLASRLKDRKARAFLEFEDASDGNSYLRVNELEPIDDRPGGSGSPATPISPAPNPPRSYSEVFPDDKDTANDPSDVPF